MLKVYKVGDKACFTNDPRFKELSKNKIIWVKNAKDAQLIYSCFNKNLTSYRRKYPKKKYMVITHEPYWNTFRGNRGKVKVLNCYTHKIYYDNLAYFSKTAQKLVLPIGSRVRYEGSKVKTCILASYQKVFFGRTKESLYKKRANIAMYGKDRGMVHIYGKGWPMGYSRENSRKGNWKGRKEELMWDYFFNICFENSHIKYYVTEKIWDSIKTYTLPIYYGSSWIYEIFPKNSFIDYKEFKTPEKLFQYIRKMSYSEWCQRMNKCIQVYNKIIDSNDLSKIKDKSYQNIIQSMTH